MAKQKTSKMTKAKSAKKEGRSTITLDSDIKAKLQAIKDELQCDWNQLLRVLHTQAQARKVKFAGKAAVENLIVEMVETESPDKITTQFLFLELGVNRTNIKKVMEMYKDRIEAHNKGK